MECPLAGPERPGRIKKAGGRGWCTFQAPTAAACRVADGDVSAGRAGPIGAGFRPKERGPTLAGRPSPWYAVAFAPVSSSVLFYSITTLGCCQPLSAVFRCWQTAGRLSCVLRGALPPWGGRGVGLLLCHCCGLPGRCRKKALDNVPGVVYDWVVGSISLNVKIWRNIVILLNFRLAKCEVAGSDKYCRGFFRAPGKR